MLDGTMILGIKFWKFLFTFSLSWWYLKITLFLIICIITVHKIFIHSPKIILVLFLYLLKLWSHSVVFKNIICKQHFNEPWSNSYFDSVVKIISKNIKEILTAINMSLNFQRKVFCSMLLSAGIFTQWLVSQIFWSGMPWHFLRHQSLRSHLCCCRILTVKVKVIQSYLTLRPYGL